MTTVDATTATVTANHPYHRHEMSISSYPKWAVAIMALKTKIVCVVVRTCPSSSRDFYLSTALNKVLSHTIPGYRTPTNRRRAMFEAVFSGSDTAAARWLRGLGVRRAPNLASLFRQSALDDGSVLLRLAEEMELVEAGEVERAEEDLRTLIDSAKAQMAIERHNLAAIPIWALTAQQEQKRIREAEEAQLQQDIARSAKSARTHQPPAPLRPRFGTTRARAIGHGEPNARACRAPGEGALDEGDRDGDA